MSDDLPADGMPTRAASAMSFISSSIQRSCDGSPSSANAGARRVGVTKWMLPRPPMPPSATVTRSPSCVRSAMSSPTSLSSSKYSWTTVPIGTLSTRSSPVAPCMREPLPCVPRSALKWCLKRYSMSDDRLASASTTTLPPWPPSPPSGPPFGTWASRRNDMQPAPPLPPLTWMRTLSMNTGGTSISIRARRGRTGCSLKHDNPDCI